MRILFFFMALTGLAADWPQVAGPYGTFATDPVPLVDDLTKARKIWESECADFGNAKGGSQAYRSVEQFTAEAVAKKTAPGSWSGPIVGEELVYVHSWRPTGAWFEVAGHKVRLDAEDFVVAIDPLTGKTKWQTFVPGGILRGGGKREGFQVGPVFHKGVVVALTSTAKLVAFDAQTGKIKWESDAHPERAAQKKAREDALAGLAAGKFKYDGSPDRCASMAVVGGVLIVPFGFDGLIGVDLATGEKKWSLTKVSTRWATPASWSDRLLAANEKGELRLIEPATGKELWKLTGLGPNWSTLTPGKTHVLVNIVADSGKTKGRQRVAGRYGGVKLSLTGAEKTWEAPAAHSIPVWMDTGARNRVLYQNGRFLIPHGAKEVEGQKDVSPAFLLEEATGKVLCELPATGDRDEWLAGLIYWCGDRLISRADSFHGPTHGGRHPWQHWSTAGDKITLLPGKMDLGEFATAYEVAMEVPLVNGRMFERSNTGTLLCYDLREMTNSVTQELKLHDAWMGLPPVVVRLTLADGKPIVGALFYADQATAGLIFGKSRREAKWEPVGVDELKPVAGGVAGTLDASFGTHRWPISITNTQWTRRIPATTAFTTNGTLVGRAASPWRVFPTPWFKDKLWTVLATNAPGTTTWVLQLDACLPKKDKLTGLTITFDHDGHRVTRAAGLASSYNQAWHEVDATGLRIESGKVQGDVIVIINSDPWVTAGFAGKISIQATAAGEGLAGTYKATWGMPLERHGMITCEP